MLFMGIDIGTQGARTVVIRSDGELIASRSAAFRSINASPVPNRYEQVADDWWDAASGTIASCVAQVKDKGYRAEDIRAISVDGTSGTIVPLDNSNQPLTNALMYNDMRAADQAKQVRNACRGIEAKIGYRFNASFSLPRILCIQQEQPEVYEKTAVFAHQADYIVGKLCSEYRVSDYSNALKTGYDLVDNRWPDCITSLGLDPGRFPSIVPPGAPIGKVTEQVSKELGLSTDTLVVGGSTDGYASALAAGATKPGDWASIIGTTLVLKGVTRELVIDPSGSSYSHRLPEGSWMLGGASNIGGRCINQSFDPSDFDQYNLAAARLVPTGILSYPLVGHGERFPFVDPAAEAFTIGDIPDKESLFASLMEGVGYAERFALEHMMALGCEVGPVICTSGGACRSTLWLSIRASILDRQLKVPCIVDAAMGSAMLAAIGSFGSLASAAQSMIRFDKMVDPVSGWVGRYEALYRQFEAECRSRFRLGGEA